MKIDKEKVCLAFERYCNSFDCSDDRISLKILHTYHVSELCKEIAESIGLDCEDTDLAWMIGILHDIGRFEQLKEYGTFDDSKSINHAQAGEDLLFGRGMIRKFVAETSEDDVISAAVRYHNMYRLPEDLDSRTVLFCNIIRDADKIDILRVAAEVPLETICDSTIEESRKADISESVLKDISERRAVFNGNKKTPVDFAVGRISLVFELEYFVSKQIISRQNHLSKLLNYDTENEETKKKFTYIKECVDSFLKDGSRVE